MLNPATRKNRWLPVLALFVPGSCYAYSALIPQFDPTFFAVGLALTALSSFGFLYLVLTPSREPPPLLQLALSQCLVLPAPLIATHVWMYELPRFAPLMVSATWILFALGWVLPFVLPRQSNTVYKEMWYPKSPVARALLIIVFALIGTSGVEGAMTGQDIVRTYGVRAGMLVVGLISLISGFGTAFYLSVALWRRKHHAPAIPSPE